ncbi:transcription-repair coupling factor [Celeribacter ethanolicus]|uniref:Transcription-repair-coupling factor n=1 Tax=Celeribacter ethanolicus TaxID=1758178 RepID=A0A291G960_9RHOB|nr:transcription-repair coupling factor [Celeribacter ethanolicus]ATG46697.1 transcription-repair coupling factor [Celeribacter ethanolicus]
MSKANHLTVGGAPEGFDAFYLAREVARSEAPVIHVARDDKRLAALRDGLRFFAPDLPVLEFPAWDCLPFDRSSPNPDLAAQRMATLAALAHGAVPKRFVLLTTLSSATQRVPARDTLAEAAFTLRKGQRVNEAELRAFFVRMGFTQAPTVVEHGDYAIRGGIIDVFPPGQVLPVRLDFFGDELDGIRRFDPASQKTVDTLAEVSFTPVSEVILDEPAITRFRQNYRIEFGAAGTDDPLYEAVTAGRKHAGMEHWLPYFHERLDTIFDYLPGVTISLDNQSTTARLSRWEGIEDQYQTRREALAAKGRLDSVYKPCPPGLLYLDDAAWEAATEGRRVIHFHPLPQASGPGVIDAGGRVGRNFSPERQMEGVNLFEELSGHIRKRREVGQVIVASWSEGARERLKSLLEDEDLNGLTEISDWRDVPDGIGGVYLAVWTLDQGFEAPVGDGHSVTVISEQDVLGDRLIRRPGRRKKAENFLTEHSTLSPGDLIVHVEHGVGIFRGLEVVTALGAAHECLLLEYAGGDRLYLPVENIELLSRYGHDEGLLDKLGGGAWQAKKARMKERIREVAEKLIRIAAERHIRKAPIMEPPEDMWEAFCARFPYTETEDQMKAIEDVLDDLDRGMPMDRLVCGDVGFGKTEVAMRAAFVAALSGAQVAVIAPTTLLARQHFRSFAERFRGFPINIRPMSRFVSAKDMAKTREELAEGTVDIVVGTHALLAKSVKFANLGLLIVDEEQRFGVTHKERLKSLKSNIHVLTLSATPIPRTLQMSLTGVRDLSIIGTPPVDRLSIRTYVSEFDTVTIREALLREHYRGGQSFFVVPRVSDIPEIEEFLKAQVPELTHVVAHGQMAAGELDDRMNAFYDGKYDVLLATTIVESGIDIPTANTMVVHRADMFGLAQLYQIRGRVGRAKTRAYAYLTTNPRAPLTPQAEKRLRVLGSLDTLGAGFTLASQDLDIRGAGNLVGEEQSGHVKEVGFELYQSMLEEAIARIKSGEEAVSLDDDGQWAPQINLGVPVLIPETYVPDLDVRLGLYRRLSGLKTKVELEGFAAELIDRFGKLPKEVNTLLLVVRIKEKCREAGIARLDGGPKGATIQFHNDKYANPAGLVEFIHGQKGQAKVKDNKIIIRRDWKKDSDKIKGAYSIAQDLAKFAKTAAQPSKK